MVLERIEDKIIPFDTNTVIENKRIYIRSGQLIKGEGQKKHIHGVGRQMIIVPRYDQDGENIVSIRKVELREG